MGINNLVKTKCKPCEAIGNALKKEETNAYLKTVPDWTIDSNHKTISRQFTTKNFVSAVKLINLIKDVAEHQNHHPDLHLTNYRTLRVNLTTHALGGLTENDFIIAANIDTLPVELKR